MKTLLSVTRPPTLEEGRKYLLRTHLNGNNEVVCVPVIFLGYCSCPAMVCVEDGAIRRFCPRDDIFTYAIKLS
jgi:hypothetical protein